LLVAPFFEPTGNMFSLLAIEQIYERIRPLTWMDCDTSMTIAVSRHIWGRLDQM
jgi:hypothetical protein